MRKGASAATACLPRFKRCRIPPKVKKRRSSIDLNRGSASRACNFRQARDDRPRKIVETPRTRPVFTERRHRLAGIPADSNARINLNFAEYGHAIGDGGLRSFAVSENVNRFAAVRASKRAHVFDHSE